MGRLLVPWLGPLVVMGCSSCLLLEDTEGNSKVVVDGCLPEETANDCGWCRCVEGSWVCDRCSRMALVPDRELDLLFVIDDGPGMAAAQARLAAAAAALLGPLQELDLDIHFGITTTSVESAACEGLPATGDAASGRLVLGSCRQRLSAFADNPEACTAGCGSEQIEVLPSRTELDPNAEPRPWIELTPWGSNIVGDVSDALRCALPQGQTGCRLSQPSRAIELAVSDPDNAGFFRDTAVLAIVVVTNGDDCSHPNASAGIFDPAGARLFWSDPEAQEPSEAVCWNAAANCSGTGDPYDDCEPANRDRETAAITKDPSAAALDPLSNIINVLQEIEDERQEWIPSGELLLFVLAGFDAEGKAVYREPGDPLLESQFGIAPGCEGDATTAAPPLRLRGMAEAFGASEFGNTPSVCAEDFEPAIRDLAAFLRTQHRPLCVPDCVADVEPEAAGLQPRCFFRERLVDGTRTIIWPCVLTDAGWDYPSEDAEACVLLRSDTGSLTPTGFDDMSTSCEADGHNLEIELKRRFPPLARSTISPACILSDDSLRDCPML